MAQHYEFQFNYEWEWVQNGWSCGSIETFGLCCTMCMELLQSGGHIGIPIRHQFKVGEILLIPNFNIRLLCVKTGNYNYRDTNRNRPVFIKFEGVR